MSRGRHVGRDQTTDERFWRNVRVDYETGCIVWTGVITGRGYARFTAVLGEREVTAHRWAYERFRTPIPDGLVLDHLCRNRACVNPAHLEAVTNGENVLRGMGGSAVNARKTHCKRGHEFTPENMTVSKKGQRICRVCTTERQRLVREGKGRPTCTMPDCANPVLCRGVCNAHYCRMRKAERRQAMAS